MALHSTIALPKIGPIRWRASGYGYQVLRFPMGGFCPGNSVYTKGISGCVSADLGPIQRGYVKVWWAGGAEWRVIDRALTVKRALQIIRQFEKEGPLFAENNDAHRSAAQGLARG